MRDVVTNTSPLLSFTNSDSWTFCLASIERVVPRRGGAGLSEVPLG